MDARASIKEAEARLGFNFKLGLARDGRAKTTKETAKLLEQIDDINQKFVAFRRSEIRKSEDLKRAANDLFEELGPSLWPSLDEINRNPPSWLLDPDRPDLKNNNHSDLYPRRRFFANEADRE